MAENKKSSISKASSCHLMNIRQPERVARRMKFTFQRTAATLNILKLDKPVQASLSLLDLSETGAGFFTERLLQKGSGVEVCITEPRLLKVKGIVAWSVPVRSGIHQTRFGFRSGVQFLFDHEMQRAALIEFIQKINTDPIENLRANASTPNMESGPDSSRDPPPPAEAGANPAATDAAAAGTSPTAEAAAPAATEVPVTGEQGAPAGTEAPAAAAEPSVDPTTPPPASEGEGGQSQAA
jgi:hypothetical protein